MVGIRHRQWQRTAGWQSPTDTVWRGPPLTSGLIVDCGDTVSRKKSFRLI